MRKGLGATRACCFLTWINLTYWCDLACAWCYAASVKSGHFMSDEVFAKILLFLSDLGAHRVLLSGGEPTLHPDFLSIVKRCHRQRLKVIVNTHGLAFADRSFLRQAADNGLAFVNLSLKGINEEGFYSHTGFNGFNQQREAVRNILDDRRVTLAVNLTLNRYFMANFGRVMNLLRQWGVKGLSIDLARPINGNDPSGGGQIPAENEAADFVSGCVSALAASDLDYLFRLDIPLCRFAGKGMSSRLAQMNFLTNCFLRDGSALIFDPLGQVIPCNILTETVLGRIGEDFNTAREHDLFLRRPDVAAKLKSLRADDKPACGTCPLSNKCCRGCAAFKLHSSAE